MSVLPISLSIPSSMVDKHERQFWLDQGMCAFISWRWVVPLAKWIGNRRCLEIMSGRGLLAYALRKLEVDIIPSDNFSWLNEGLHPAWGPPVLEVENLDCLKAIRKYGKGIHILIMSWPPYNEPTAYYAIKELYKVNRDALVVYIGEDRGGYTADDRFFDHFRVIRDPLFYQVITNYESWYGINDYPHLGRFRS